MRLGYIYVLSNEAMPGLVKIGRTERQPETRARELRTTGVPQPFRLEHSVLVSDCVSAESLVHRILKERGVRMSEDREFFLLAPSDAVRIVELATNEGHCPTNFSLRRELAEIAASIKQPVGLEQISFEEAEAVAGQLASLARRGYPPAMQTAAYIFESNCPAGNRFKPYWREYLHLARQEAIQQNSQQVRRQIGQEIADYVAICSKHKWLNDEDFEFVSAFLIAGDQFQYEGYTNQLSRYKLPSEIESRALEV